jgi:hypothetical protein
VRTWPSCSASSAGSGISKSLLRVVGPVRRADVAPRDGVQ